MAKLRESRLLDPALEMQAHSARREFLAERLRATVAVAYQNAPAAKRAMDQSGVTPDQIHALEDLTKLPITKKDDLALRQAADPPFAGLLAVPMSKLQHIFASPGPTYVPQGEGDDFWRFKMAFAAAGFRAGDVVLNTLSYHLTPGGLMLDTGLRSLGCVVIPAGVGQTDLQVKAASSLGATGYAGTPSFLRTLLLRAVELGSPLSIEVAFATAEMLPDSLRAELEGFGVRVLQGYATADLGMLAYECAEKNGMHLHPEVIVEVLDLETGQPAAPGQPGQIIATNLEPAYPLLRFATGDIGALAPESACPCGRTSSRLAGLLGRVGDAAKVKGMFVRGSQLDEVLKAFPALARIQAIITRQEHQDRLVYLAELAPGATAEPELGERLVRALREAVKVRGEVEVVPPGTIAAGAKRIEDRRVWK